MGLRRLPLRAWLVLAARCWRRGPARVRPGRKGRELYCEGASTGHRFSLAGAAAGLRGNSSSQPSLTLALVPLTIIDETSPVGRAPPSCPTRATRIRSTTGTCSRSTRTTRSSRSSTGRDAHLDVLQRRRRAVPRPFSAQPATFEGRRCVLITDRLQYRVFAVSWDARKDVLWQYGTTGEYGLGADHLMDPFAAVQLPRRQRARLGRERRQPRHRDPGERLRAGQPAHGFTVASIVWQYGMAGESGLGVNHVNQPRCAAAARQRSGRRRRHHADHRFQRPPRHRGPRRRLRSRCSRSRLHRVQHRVALWFTGRGRTPERPEQGDQDRDRPP